VRVQLCETSSEFLVGQSKCKVPEVVRIAVIGGFEFSNSDIMLVLALLGLGWIISGFAS
jgi:hypothetical protein